MNKEKLNFSVPAKIEFLDATEISDDFKDEHITKCKLKIFYIGETADRRVFTEKFSQQLLKSLPYTPVVGYYNEESDDFEAHNGKQYMFGHVPIDAKIEFEQYGDHTYAVTDIVLFTGREDIGRIAEKIIGKQHSLELKPGSVKYMLEPTQQGKNPRVVFTAGEFYGLSIVGDKETPAFEGSEFFVAGEESSFSDLQVQYNDFVGSLNKYYSQIKTCEAVGLSEQFMFDTYGDRYYRVYDALKDMYMDAEFKVVQLSDDTVVYAEYYNDQNGKHKIYNKIAYDYREDHTVVLVGGPEPVFKRFLTRDEIDMLYSDEVYSMLSYKTLAELDLKPTESMANNARRGLELRKEFGRGGTAVGVSRARDLANRKNLSPDTVARMFSFFSRHEVDKKGKGFNPGQEGYPSAGRIAWLLWGGDSGFS
jgi:hypothetical protein